MYYVGVDHHKMTQFVTTIKEDGTVYLKRRFNPKAEALRAFFEQHPRPFVVGIEAGYAWEYVADIVEALGFEIHVGHPVLLKAFAQKHKKNDKIDSWLIAWLLWRGDLPTIVHPSKEARQRRDLYRQRMDLVQRRTALSSRAKAWADRHGFQATMNLSTRKGVELLAALPAEPSSQFVLSSHVTTLLFLYDEIRRIEAEIRRVAKRTDEVMFVDSIPGMGPFLALLVASEIFDIERFDTSRRLVGYSGLAPGSWSSGGRVYQGHLCPNANRYLRWAFCEAVDHFRKQCTWANAKYNRLKKAKDWKTARIAIARHIATITFHLLRDRRPYEPERPAAFRTNGNNG